MNQYTPLRNRLLRYVVDAKGCWVWTGSQGWSRYNGRRPIMRWRGKNAYAYRVMWEFKNGAIPDGMMVCHHCDNGLCINPAHLFLGTAKDNAADSISKGRYPFQRYPEATRERARQLGLRKAWRLGAIGKSIIPHRDIPLIRKQLARGQTLRAIASQYRVSQQAVRQFIKRADFRAALALAAPAKEDSQ